MDRLACVDVPALPLQLLFAREPGWRGRPAVVVEEDKLVDEEYDMILRQCISMMMEDSSTIRRFMDVSWVARALERIGDHAKNICEYVIYLVHGKDIRHTEIEEVREHVGEKESL